MRKQKWTIVDGWEKAEQPNPRKPSHRPQLEGTKTKAAVDLIQKFLESGDDCWAKKCERYKYSSGNYSKEADSDSILLRQIIAAGNYPVRVSVRKLCLYLERL